MKVRVNLLPESYLRIRQRERRFKQGVLLGALLLVAEMAGGVALHMRARRVDEIVTRTGEIRQREERLRQKLKAPQQESERLDQEILLAEQLRSKHYWSRLLYTIGEITPEKVLLTSMSTNPSRWSKSLHRVAPRDQPEPGAPTARSPEQRGPPPRLLLGMTLRGFAADHHAVAQFVTRVHDSQLFRALDLKETRRETLMGKQGVAFELVCHW